MAVGGIILPHVNETSADGTIDSLAVRASSVLPGSNAMFGQGGGPGRRWSGIFSNHRRGHPRLRRPIVQAHTRPLAIEPLEQRALLSVGPLLADAPMLQPAADTIPPTIVSTTPSLDGGTLNVANLTLAITFSESVVHYAANASYYLLQSAGADGFLGTADDVLTHPTVTNSGTTATLRFTEYPEGVYRLTVSDSIKDGSSNELDGDGDGIAGGNWVRDFVGVHDGFAAPTMYLTGGTDIYDVSTADLNADGNLDLVVTKGVGVVVILLGTGDGTFSAAGTYSTGGEPYGPNVGDFNGDQKPDVAVVNWNSDTVGVLLGDCPTGFSPVVTYAAGGWYPSDLTTGDFNSDGKLDLALVHSEAPGTFGVLLGNGDGTFQPVTTFSSGGNYAYAIVTADFNSDGNLDMAATNLVSATVAICLGDGTGAFSAATTTATGGSSPEYLDAGDFNGDGKLDLAVANRGSSNIGVLFGNGDGTFTPVTTYATNATYPIGIVVSDVNRDGNADILASTSAGLSLLLGRGDGTFAPIITYNTGGKSYVTALGDFDGDGDLDAAVAIGTSLAVMQNDFKDVSATLMSPHGFPFEVSKTDFGAGELLQGHNNAFDGDGRLLVDGATFQPANGSYSLTDAGQSVVTADGTLAGLTVSREVTVPNTGNEDFARTIDSFTNSTASAITTTVTIVGNLGSDAATRVFATSDGDTLVEATDQWIGTNGGPDTPSVIHYIHGPVGLQPSSVEVIGDNVTWTYTLTVYAGQTVRLAYFTIVADTETVAIAAAETLVSGKNFGGEAAAFLTTDELHSLLNFDFATTRTWDGGGTDNNWSSPANWTDDIAPVAGDLLVFAGDLRTSSNNDFPAGTMFDSITFAGDGLTLSGNSVTLSPTGGVAIDNVLGQNRIDLAIAPESTGAVVVEAGTLELGPNAQTIVLSGNGADIQGGMIVLDYMGEADPVATVASLLTASYTAQTAIASTRVSSRVRPPAHCAASAGPTTRRPARSTLPIRRMATPTWTAARISLT